MFTVLWKKKRRRQVVATLSSHLPDPSKSLDLETLTQTLGGLVKIVQEKDLMAWISDATNNTFIGLQRWLRVRSSLELLAQADAHEIVARIQQGSIPTVELEAAMRLGVTQEISQERLESTGLATFDKRQRASSTVTAAA